MQATLTANFTLVYLTMFIKGDGGNVGRLAVTHKLSYNHLPQNDMMQLAS